MKIALCTIDLQHDFLEKIFPCKQEFLAQVEHLLKFFRMKNLPVIHIRTTVTKQNDMRMPHWKQQNKWMCVEGTPGHQMAISYQEKEPIIDKTYFSAFTNKQFPNQLTTLGIDTLIIAGVHTQSCIQATALDAYQQGYRVYIAKEATASYDPIHSTIAQLYLQQRSMSFLSHAQIEALFTQDTSHYSHNNILPSAHINKQNILCKENLLYKHFAPTKASEVQHFIPIANNEEVASAAQNCKLAFDLWQNTSLQKRIDILKKFIDFFAKETETLIEMMVDDIGKPYTSAQIEVERSIDLMNATLNQNFHPQKKCSQTTKIHHQPLGTVAIITPWNNPVGIPLGKIIPALFYGNTVVWKPAPQGTRIAYHIINIWNNSGIPANIINILSGDHTTAEQLMMHSNIDAVTISGSIATGHTARSICALRGIPLQAELGGNNAAIVWQDANLPQVASQIVASAFDFAGQRCTATSRVIISEACYDTFINLLKQETQKLIFGDPKNKNTRIGPMISQHAVEKVNKLVQRTSAEAQEIWHASYNNNLIGAYYPPTIISCNNPQSEIIQNENFAPILVLQKAKNWQDALHLCNNVPHGLTAALFSPSQDLQNQFLAKAQAGMLKINRPTTDINEHTPFAGWKASAIGPPEHGEGNLEFYTKRQSIYF